MTKRPLVGWVLVLAAALFGGAMAKAQTDQKPPTLAELRIVRSLVYSPDGSFLLVYHNSLGVWDTKTGQLRVGMEEKAPSPWDCIAISPDGKKAAAIAMYFSKKMGRDLKIWDVATGKLVEEQILPEWTTGKSPPFLKFSPDGAFLYSIWDKQILEAKLGGKNRLLAHKLDNWAPEQGGWDPAKVAFDPQAQLLIVAHNNVGKPGAQLGFFNLAKEGEPQSIPITDRVSSMALSRDGKTLAISFDRRFTGKPKLELWDVATFKPRTSLPVDARKNFECYHRMVFAPDGKMLAGAPFFTDRSERMLDLLDLEGKISQEIAGGDDSAYGLTFSPDGKTLAVIRGDTILFVDPATGETRRPGVAPDQAVKKEKQPRQQNEAEKLFRAMEKKITDAKALQVAVTLEIREKESGLKNKTIRRKGSLLLMKEHGNKVRLKIRGEDWFGDLDERRKETTVDLVSDGRFVTVTWGKDKDEEKTRPAPKHFAHLLSMLVIHEGAAIYLKSLGNGSAPPNFQPFWAQIDGWNFKEIAPEKVGGRQARVVSYQMGYTEGDNGAVPDAEKKGTPVTVWIDSETLLPLKHVIAGKDQRWTTIYNDFILDPKIDAKAFKLPR